jgi:hypothetical protein
VNAPEARGAKLEMAHVLALRLYTTACFRSLNQPLREALGREDGVARPHPFAATVHFLDEAIKRLRRNHCGDSKVRDLWRGLKDVRLAGEFSQKGGTEMACTSTTSDPSVALRYATPSHESAALVKIKAASALVRGADLRWVSAFPTEHEYLYPPLLYLQPTGKSKAFEIARGDSGRTCTVTVIETTPVIS